MSISTSCEKTLINWMILLRDKFIFQWRIEQKKGDFFGSGYSVLKNIEPVGCTIA